MGRPDSVWPAELRRPREGDREQRTLTDGHFEIRADEAGEKIRGYAAVFHIATVIWPGWMTEIIAPGAFTASLARPDDVRALFNHDASMVLGRNVSGTLDLGEDGKGLWYEINPPDTMCAKDLMTLIRRGDVSQSSFAFQVLRHMITDNEDGSITRTVLEAKLFDVSPVTYPAYQDTTTSVRERQVDDIFEMLKARVLQHQEPEQARTSHNQAMRDELAALEQRLK